MTAATSHHYLRLLFIAALLFVPCKLLAQITAPARLEVDSGLRPMGRPPTLAEEADDSGRMGQPRPRQDPSPPLTNDDYRWNEEQLGYMEHVRLWHLQARISAGWWYDDNITLSEDDSQNPQEGDSYFNVRPSIDISYGPNSWGFSASIAYDVDFRTYTDGGLDDEFNQAVGLGLNWTGSRTRAYLSTGYAAIDGGNIDIGDRVQQNVMNLSAGLSYDLTGKTTLGVGYATELLDYSGEFFASNTHNVSAYIDYKVTPKTTIGLGGGYGFTEVDGGTDYDTYDLNLRVSWAATDRLTVGLTGGVQYLDGSGGDFSETTPTFTFDLDYDLFENGRTSLKIGAYRNFHSSALLVNQGYWSDGGFLDFSHQLGARTQVALALGYEHAEYEATAADVDADRVDDYFYIRPHMSYAVSTRCSFSLFYQFSQNDSSGNGATSFERNSVGIMANYAF